MQVDAVIRRDNEKTAASGGLDFGRSYWRKAPATGGALADMSPDTIDDAQFRLLADNIPTLCWMANGDGYIVWYNRRWHEYCGTTPEQMEGWGWQSVHDPELLPAVMERWTAAISTGQPFEMTFPLKGADGVFRPFLTRIQPVRDASGRVARWFGVNTEISDQVAAEEALRAERDLSRGVLEGMAEGFVLLDREFRVREINAEGLRLEQRPREEIVGKTHWEAWPGSEDSELGRLYKRAMAERVPVSLEHRYAWADGHAAWLDMRAYPVADGLAIFYRDVSERKEADQALRETSRRLNAVLNNTTMAVFLMDDRQHCVYANAAAEALTGYGFAEMRGRPLHDVVHHKHPDGRHYPIEECPIDRAFPEDYQVQGEELFVHKDGRFYPVAFTASPIRDEGSKTIGTIIEVRGIAEEKAAAEALRASESRYRALVEAIGTVVWTTRADGSVEDMPQWRALTGQTVEEVRGFGWLDAIHPDDRDATATAWAAAVDAREPVDVEYRVRSADGRYRWYNARGVPVFAAEGTVREWVGVCIDIHERRQAEAELRRLNETLESRVAQEVAERAKAEAMLRQAQKMEAIGQLTGGVAHDFNNLLTVVVGNLERVERRLAPEDADLSRAVQRALTGAERAAALTRQLLAYARKQPLQPAVIDPNRLVGEAADLLHRTLGEAVAVEVALAADLWRTRVDPNQLASALLNLAVNARDAMPNGGSLRISTRNVPAAEAAELAPDLTLGPCVLIEVADTGTGMTADVVERAFEPFYTTKPLGQGSGLGLSQVYGFVKQSRGHVVLDSAPGRGTAVRLYLPAVVEANSAEEIAAGSGPMALAPSYPGAAE